MTKVCVLGDGGWGTALAMVLERNGHAVTVWGPFQEQIDQIRADGENKTFLPGVPVPEAITWTSSREKAMDGAAAVVIVVPSRFFAEVLTGFAPHIDAKLPVVSATKGIDKDSHHRMSEVAEAVLGQDAVAALSGPSHAEEVARGVPSAVSVACRDLDRAVFFQDLFTDRTFRVYTLTDVVGVELGGALKNVIAIAAGLCDGLGYGDNTKAALMTRGLAEIARLGRALGADPATFSGLSGMGDLIVTCASKLSRNRAVGERLGRGESPEAIMSGMKQVAEGVWNCANARTLARKHGVDVPITDEVYAIIHEGKDPREAVKALLMREPKEEF